MSKERSRPAAPLIAKAVLWLVLAALYIPIAVMLIGAVVQKTPGGIVFSLQAFAEVLQDGGLVQALWNSVVIGFSSSVLATVLGTLAALGLRRNQKSWRRNVQALSVVSLIFPEIVFALSLLSWFFILQFELGRSTVILAHVSFSLSYVMMTVQARLSTLETSLEDAARDLGANSWQVQKLVLLPLLKPAILGGFILSFLLSFDDFLITYFVNGVGQDTLPVKLYTAMKMGVSPKLNALSSVMFLMTLFILIFFFRSSSFRVLFEESRGTNGSKSEEKNF
ncbi:ABC transporter permease [Bdellovibrio sp. ArHS]|uniref:ABC transporter permease n=1 Tax=Bdellovibrio sp. ArHS TaxID=1569284 RepID=UPI000AA7FC77|nr:ABC transporter permease [Bdellovibrio sp. ArHS]